MSSLKMVTHETIILFFMQLCIPWKNKKCVPSIPVAHAMKEKRMTTSTPPATIPPGQGPTWHTLSSEEALREQGVDAATGLSQEEVQSRMKKYGPNKFAEAKKIPGYIAFLNQYQHPMQIVLLVAAVVSIIIQQWSTALILIILTLFNAFLALRQEGKAEASVAALQKMLIVKSKV